VSYFSTAVDKSISHFSSVFVDKIVGCIAVAASLYGLASLYWYFIKKKEEDKIKCTYCGKEIEKKEVDFSLTFEWSPAVY